MTNVVDELLGGIDISGSWYASVQASRPWAFSSDGAPVTRLVVLTAGRCLLTSHVLAEPLRLETGDCVIVQSGVDLVLRDSLTSFPIRCEGLAFDGVQRTRLGGDGATTEMLTGRFSTHGGVASSLFGVLPPIMRVRLDEHTLSSVRSTLHLMELEVSEPSFGAETVAGRLADVLFIQVLRAWSALEGGANAVWLVALRDSRLTPTLKALHDDLAHEWTVSELAGRSMMSRSSFADAFRSATGETPLGYLTRWRIHRAKALLRETPLSVLAVANAVGYQTDTALSRAFRKFEDVPPGVWRRQQAGLVDVR